MSSLKRGNSTTEFKHSPLISTRRRSLFPTGDCDIDAELGRMEPLHSDNSSNGDDTQISDYDIIGIVDSDVGVQTPMSDRGSKTMSPLCLSPFTESLHKYSPSQNLKTPHDSATKSALSKVQRDVFEESKSLKRNLSSFESPPTSRSSKIRTALFSAEPSICLPVKSFYPKSDESGHKILPSVKDRFIAAHTKSISPRQPHKPRRKFGQINNGVSHKIRKPKQKKMSKVAYTKATKKMIESCSALNEYIKDMKEMNGVRKKLIETPPQEEVDPVLKEYMNDIAQINNSTKLITNPMLDEENKENVPLESRKRPLSPSEEPEDCNERFFKNRKIEKPLPNTTTQSEAQETPTTLQSTINPHSEFDTTEEDEEIEENLDIDRILSALNGQSPGNSIIETDPQQCFTTSVDHQIVPNSNENYILDLNTEIIYTEPCQSQAMYSVAQENVSNVIFLEAHSSVAASENSIQLHANVANELLSPISQMCDVTSGLVLDSPKRGRDLTSVLNGMPNNLNGFDASDMEKKGLFPIFYGGARSVAAAKKEKTEHKRHVKKFKGLAEGQMLLDAGQKKFGYAHCGECDLVYHKGDPGDEIEHMNYHSSSNLLRFSGWKNEHVVADFHKEGRIIRVFPSDSKIWIKKVRDLLEIVNRDLGLNEMDSEIDKSQVYLYIKSRLIAGCAVATVPKSQGHRMLSTAGTVAMCSEESYPIKCGISHIWVEPNFRKSGVATALMNAVKNTFVFGCVLGDGDVALISPTEDGAAFAAKYFGTPNYLVSYG